jgi:hypothetical protein
LEHVFESAFFGDHQIAKTGPGARHQAVDPSETEILGHAQQRMLKKQGIDLQGGLPTPEVGGDDDHVSALGGGPRYMTGAFDVNALKASLRWQTGHMGRFDYGPTEMAENPAGKPVHLLCRPIRMDKMQIAGGYPTKVRKSEVQYPPEQLATDP